MQTVLVPKMSTTTPLYSKTVAAEDRLAGAHWGRCVGSTPLMMQAGSVNGPQQLHHGTLDMESMALYHNMQMISPVRAAITPMCKIKIVLCSSSTTDERYQDKSVTIAAQTIPHCNRAKFGGMANWAGSFKVAAGTAGDRKVWSATCMRCTFMIFSIGWGRAWLW